MAKRETDIERAERVTRELKAATEEARFVLQEARGFVKDVIALNTYSRNLLEEEIEAKLNPILDRWANAINKACEDHLHRKVDECMTAFDRWFSALNGTDKAGRKSGELPMSELAQIATDNERKKGQ
jgi:hypothetical protein